MNVQLARGIGWGIAGWLLLAAAPASSSGQERAIEKTTVERQRTTSARTVNRVTTVMKSEVVLKGGSSVGKVVDFVVNDHGCIDYLVAQDEDELFLIPYSAAVVSYERRSVEIAVTPQQFKSVTRFSSERWPDLHDATFQQQLFRFWGVKSSRPAGSTFEERTSGKPIQPGAGSRDDDRPEAPAARDNAPKPRDPKAPAPREPSGTKPEKPDRRAA